MIFFIGGHDRRVEGREWFGVLGREQQPPLHQLGCLGGRRELPHRGSKRNPDHPNVCHYFQHSGWPLSPDIIILFGFLIVDYYAAVGGKTPVPPLRTLLLYIVCWVFLLLSLYVV